MFHTTLPLDAPELLPVSSFLQYLDEQDLGEVHGRVPSMWTTLPGGLRSDLQRFKRDGRQPALLQAVAGAVRHSVDVCLQLAHGHNVVPLTLFPAARLVHAPIPLDELLASGMRGLRVLQVEPALVRPPGKQPAALVDDTEKYRPLAQLTRALAMRGDTSELLPEIDGPAAYRVSPALTVEALALPPELQQVARALQERMWSLCGISEHAGVPRDRVARLLNAVYLQAGLIVSRTHPLAIQEMPLLRQVH